MDSDELTMIRERQFLAHIKELEGKLDAKATALCTANDRYDTVVAERDAALSRLDAAIELLRFWLPANELKLKGFDVERPATNSAFEAIPERRCSFEAVVPWPSGDIRGRCELHEGHGGNHSLSPE
jgi:hypothetical protein